MSGSVIDLFCGAGGLSQGFKNKGFRLECGIDLDESCRYAYEQNNDALFISKDLMEVSAEEIKYEFSNNLPSVLVGCAPCRGWLGTVSSPSQLTDESSDNLNRIAVFMRGKLAQENILSSFGMKEIFADYLIGEIHCDSLDIDGDEDIATSSRQSLKEDDDRFVLLRKFIHIELRHIANRWSEYRNEEAVKVARGVPEVAQWLDALPSAAKKKAQKWVGRLNVIRTSDDETKKEILKASILAFESYRRKEDLETLEKIDDNNLEQMLTIFGEIDDLELSYYGQIVKLRIGIINALQEKLKKDEKEKAIQQHIFDHLWLLDSSWERASGSEHIETTVNNFLKNDTKKLSAEEKKARIDIGYRTASGRHVIVKLKRASVKVEIDDLVKQIRKYRSGARKLLDKTAYDDWPLDIVCLLGEHPKEWSGPNGKADVLKAMDSVDARIVYYDELLNNAQKSYADYLERHKEIDKLWNIFQAIEDFTI